MIICNPLSNNFKSNLIKIFEFDFLFATVKPGTPTLALDMDLDNNLSNETAILMGGTTYTFTCTSAGLADPEADITFELEDHEGASPLDTQTKSSGETVPDCTRNSVQDTYQLTPAIENQCGVMRCTANSGIDVAGQSKMIKTMIYSKNHSNNLIKSCKFLFFSFLFLVY